METTKTLVNSLLVTTIVAVSCVATAMILKQAEEAQDVFMCKIVYTDGPNSDDPNLFSVNSATKDIVAMRSGFCIFYCNYKPTIKVQNNLVSESMSIHDGIYRNATPIMIYKGDSIINNNAQDFSIQYITPDRYVKSMFS